MTNILVSVRCLVYNHAPYLRQCLDGIVMQKTNFRFEAIVHDDASTDESVKIIQEYAQKYPDIIIPVLEEENQYSKKDGSLQRIMDKYMKGKYIAHCEGDDYWIDPYKLEKQVAILENNPVVSLCYTRSRTFNQEQQVFSNYLNCENGPTDFEGMLLREPPITLTCLYRRELYYQYKEEIMPETKGWLMGDTPIWLWMSLHGEIALLNDITAVYRRLEESASHIKNIEKQLIFNKSAMDIRKFFCEKYNRTDLIQDVMDLYRRSCASDAASNKEMRLCLNSFKEIKKKRLADYINLFRYMIHILL